MRWLHQVRAQDQEKPWFVYYSTGCSHAPHQVAVEWSEKYRGKFDQGWDVLREETFERQKALGVIPPDTVLTPRPDALPAWDSLSDGEKKLYARQMEVYAGFQENADWNVGRLLDAVEEMGELDNTLVIYIFGDNGASLEGTLTGSFNELTMQNGIALTAEQQLSLIEQYGGLDAWGTDAYAPHYAAAWAWAGNTPFQWGKQVRLPPRRHAQRHGRLLAGADQGRRRAAHPVHARASTSGRRSSKRPASPSPRSWTGPPRSRWRGRASSTPSTTRTRRSGTPCSTSRSSATGRSTRTAGGPPASSTGSPGTSRRRRWRGSHPEPTTRSRTPGSCTTSPTTSRQANDLAAENPEKLAELKELFWEEAEKHNVLPLLAGFSVFFGILPPMPTITTQTFYGDVENIASGMIPRVYGRSYAIEAELSVPDGRRRGRDRRRGGRDGRLLALGRRERPAAPQLLDDGRRAVQAGLDRADPDRGRHGPHAVRRRPAGTVGRRDGLAVRERREDRRGADGEDGRRPLLRATPAWTSAATTACPSTAPTRTRSPYPFTGTVKKVVFDLKPGSHDDEKALHEAGAHVAAAHGISA